MKKSILAIAIVVAAAAILSGCGQVIGLVLKPDLAVEYINVTEGPDGWTGMEFSVGNWGGPTDNDAEYAIYLSYGSSINPATDFKVYESEVEVEWNSEKVVYLNFATDVDPYIQASGQFIPEGELYLGVFMDPADKETERDEQNNDLTVGPFLFGGGGSGSVDPDPFEPDDNSGSATDLPNFDQQAHTFHQPGDTDWFYFYADAGWFIGLATFDSGPDTIWADTVMKVYDPSMLLIFESDDDPGNPPFSRIEFNAPVAGTYYVELYHYFDDIGEYTIERYF